MDLILLIDSSEAGRSPNFDSERKFAEVFFNHILTSDVQIGLYTFGKSVFKHFALNEHSYLPYISQVVQSMWASNGNGSLAQALQEVISTGFSSSTGDRECAPNILVAVTHTGVTDDMSRSLKDLLLSKKIKAILLNMAGQPSATNLAAMVNDSSRVFTISTFTELEGSVSNLVEKIKKGIIVNFLINNNIGYLTNIS